MNVTQPVVWVVQFNDGTQKMEVDEKGNETLFTDEEVLKKKKDFHYIGLKDLVNGITYSIDLHNGKFILRGQNFSISKEVDGRIYTMPTEVDFADGVIQFKCSKPMKILFGKPLPTKASPQTFNIGYKVPLPEGFCSFRKGESIVTITHCQAMLSIDADSMEPSISATWTGKMETPDGKTYELKL
jgi:hypothetical protein